MELKNSRKKLDERTADQVMELLNLFYGTYRKLIDDAAKPSFADYYSNAFISWTFKTLLEQGWEPKVNRVDERVLDYLDRIFPHDSDARATLPVGQFTDEVLRHGVLVQWNNTGTRGLRHEGISYTNADVSRLAVKLLDINDGDMVADLCCGIGSFMIEALGGTCAGGFLGVDFNYDALMVAMMRASVIEVPVEMLLGNAFEVDGSFDKVFVDAPWGIRLGDEPQLHTESMNRHVRSGATKRVTSEWLFALKALDCLKEGGKAVVTMPMGGLSGSASASLRRQLVRSGSIVAVVALPKGLMPGTGMPPNLLVLGTAEEGRPVTFVDASDLGGGRLTISMNADDIAEVIRRLGDAEGDHTAVATADEIASEGWSLVPVRYIDRIELEDVVALGSLATSITRGVGQIKLDERSVDEESCFHYLETRSLDEDGNVVRLTNLDEIKPREERYCVQDGDVVLGKSSPFRTAVVRVKPDEQVLCSGNFYIIRPDHEKIDPVYLKLFLDSRIGQSQLRRISTGAVMLTIPVKDLKDLQIPLVPMEEQREIAERYESFINEIALYRRRIERTRAKIDGLFPMGGQA